MPQITNHQSGNAVKALILGDSGSGKSGALAALALDPKLAQRLIVADFDNGLDILFHLLQASPEAAARVFYETFTDKFRSAGAGIIMPDGKVRAWTDAMSALTEWKFPEREVNGVKWPAYDLGKNETWGPETTLVIDSLNFASWAAMRHVLATNGRSGKAAFQSDWGEAQRLTEDLLALLYSDAVRCNVIVNTHVAFLTNEADQSIKGLPMVIGKALSPKIGRYFNTVLQVRTKGQGNSARRVIVTRSEGLVELKNPAPGKILPEYPLETGLAEIFKVLLNKS